MIKSLITTCNISNLENCLLFDPTPKGKSVYYRKTVFQIYNDLVICTKLKNGDSHEILELLQVWKVKDHSKYKFSLDIKYSDIFLAPNGLTIITCRPTSCYSWNYDISQFHPFYFADEAYLYRYTGTYLSNGKFFTCCSFKNNNIWVWDTWTGQLCSKPITMSNIDMIALSSILNDQGTTTVFDTYTGHLYAQVQYQEILFRGLKVFIWDGTKFMSSSPIRIYNIVDLAAKYQNASHEYACDLWYRYIMGQDNRLLFLVPPEHRNVLCPSQVKTIPGQAMKVDFSNFKFSTKWTECIDQEWLKEVEKRGKQMGRLLG